MAGRNLEEVQNSNCTAGEEGKKEWEGGGSKGRMLISTDPEEISGRSKDEARSWAKHLFELDLEGGTVGALRQMGLMLKPNGRDLGPEGLD